MPSTEPVKCFGSMGRLDTVEEDSKGYKDWHTGGSMLSMDNNWHKLVSAFFAMHLLKSLCIFTKIPLLFLFPLCKCPVCRQSNSSWAGWSWSFVGLLCSCLPAYFTVSTRSMPSSRQ